jgi:hypothetical protein
MRDMRCGFSRITIGQGLHLLEEVFVRVAVTIP